MLTAFMLSIDVESLHRILQRSSPLPQVNVPKTKKAFCKGCKKHMTMKVTQYKTGKASLYAQGKQGRAAGSMQAAGCCNSSSSSSSWSAGGAVFSASTSQPIAPSCCRQEALRPQAGRFRWSDKACVPQEGEQRLTESLQNIYVAVMDVNQLHAYYTCSQLAGSVLRM
jgi:hypothetical protein